jgi:hypothetical protein
MARRITDPAAQDIVTFLFLEGSVAGLVTCERVPRRPLERLWSPTEAWLQRSTPIPFNAPSLIPGPAWGS